MACYKCRITRRKVNTLERKVAELEERDISSDLVSGENIKTINGASILGEGNLNITSYRIFNDGWNTSSIKQLCDSIVADSTAEAGMVYYGKFTGSGLPSVLGQAEMIIEVIADDISNGKSLHLNVFSADTSPYKWEAQYVKINGNYPQNISWKGYLLEINNSNKLNANYITGLPTNVSLFNNDVPYVTDALMKVGVIDANGHNYVDLGLPSGTLWATCNVGANSETEYGNYYQYGKGAAQYAATSGESTYDGTENPLATSVDTVAQVWGGSWHMPTKAQFEELIANTTYEWTTINGVNGGKFTSQNGNYVFFAAAGYLLNGSQSEFGSGGNYWSSTPGGSINAYGLYFYDDSKDVYNNLRKDGCSVRGIIEPTLAPKYATKQELSALETDMDAKISSAYHHAGTKTAAQLTSSLLTAEHEGEVYNITQAGTTTADFLEGVGLPIDVGANVGVARIVDGNNISYKFDLLSGIIDTSGFVNKSQTAGLLKNDGTVDTNTYLTLHQDISGKANSADLAIVATSGSYNDLLNRPDLSNYVASTTVRNIVVLTQELYDALVTKDANTEYNIIGLL